VPAPLQAFIAHARRRENGHAYAERRRKTVSEGCVA
jgi:hypothetical protein